MRILPKPVARRTPVAHRKLLIFNVDRARSCQIVVGCKARLQLSKTYIQGFQRSMVARKASTSSGFKSTSGGRTGPPTKPIMSIIDFIADTS